MSILLDAFKLAPTEAVAYLRKKGMRFSWNYTDTWQQEHARSFTVAKVMRADILQDIRDGIDSALADGKTFEQFKKELTPLLQAKGWWGQQMLMDEKGQAELVQLGSPRRLQTIYQTNMQSALMTGRYNGMMQSVSMRPYWQYIAVMDNRTRPSHSALNGLVFRYDDPFWNTHYPPNGYRCRCQVVTRSERELNRLDIEPISSDGLLVDKEVLVSERSGIKTTVTGLQTPSGKIVYTDPGFNFNPGKVSWKPDLKKYDPPIAKQLEKALPVQITTKPAPVAKSKFIPAGFEKKIGKDVLPNEFWDKIGRDVPLTVKAVQATHYNPMLDSVQIGTKRSGPKEEIKKYIATHEYAHALFHRLRKNDGELAKIKSVFNTAKEEFAAFPLHKKRIFSKVNYQAAKENYIGKLIDIYPDEDAVKERLHSVFDCIAATTDSQYGDGHKRAYFRRNWLVPINEFFAHMAEHEFRGNAVLDDVFPKTAIEVKKYWNGFFGRGQTK